MDTNTDRTRITLGDAFTAMRHALVQAREAGYRTGRSISPTATDADLETATEANRQADALAVTAWRALYSAVASTPEDEALAAAWDEGMRWGQLRWATNYGIGGRVADNPYRDAAPSEAEEAEEAEEPHRWVITDGVATNADAWCLDCDGPAEFCPAGAR